MSRLEEKVDELLAIHKSPIFPRGPFFNTTEEGPFAKGVTFRSQLMIPCNNASWQGSYGLDIRAVDEVSLILNFLDPMGNRGRDLFLQFFKVKNEIS